MLGWSLDLLSFSLFIIVPEVLLDRNNAMDRQHDQVNACEGRHLIGTNLQFQMLSPLYHGGKHDIIQADLVLEKEMRVLHVDWKAARKLAFKQLG